MKKRVDPEFLTLTEIKPHSPIDNLLKIILEVSNDPKIHVMTPIEIGDLIGRKLNKFEKRIWSKYRQEVIRRSHSRRATVKNTLQQTALQIEYDRKRTSLLGLSNDDLCEKIILLEQSHRVLIKVYQNDEVLYVEKKGKASTNQLISALALHTNTEISQLVFQIKSFNPKQKAKASEAIETILSIHQAIRMRSFQDQQLLELPDSGLREYLVLLYNGAQKYLDGNILMSSFSEHLNLLNYPSQVLELQSRISKLSVTYTFTKAIRQAYITAIDQYKPRPKKPKRDYLGRVIPE